MKQRIDYHFKSWALPKDEANALMDRVAEVCNVDSLNETCKLLESYEDTYLNIKITVTAIDDRKIYCRIENTKEK